MRDLETIRAELERVEARDAELQSALDGVEHDARRCNDALERAGWRSAEAETRSRLLAESRDAIVADRERLRTERQRLEERLARTRERLQGKKGDD